MHNYQVTIRYVQLGSRITKNTAKVVYSFERDSSIMALRAAMDLFSNTYGPQQVLSAHVKKED